MGKPMKFPHPADCAPKEPAVFCTATRIRKLYNQNSGDTVEAKSISQKVRSWFLAEAEKQGWAGVHFLSDFQTKISAGCLLWLPPQKVDVEIKVTRETLILLAEKE